QGHRSSRSRSATTASGAPAPTTGQGSSDFRTASSHWADRSKSTVLREEVPVSPSRFPSSRADGRRRTGFPEHPDGLTAYARRPPMGDNAARARLTAWGVIGRWSAAPTLRRLVALLSDQRRVSVVLAG